MASEDPGTRTWTAVLTAAAKAQGRTAPVAGIALGGDLHNALVSPKLRPGSRAYMARLRELAAAGTAPQPIAFWKFTEAAPPYASEVNGLALQLTQGAPTKITTGPWGGGVRLNGTTSLNIPLASVGPLDLDTCTVIAWVQRIGASTGGAMVAGRWDETGAQRQYALFHHLPTYGGGRRVCGHVSLSGGATPSFPFSIDYSACARKHVGSEAMRCWAMTYDGAEAISYLDGVADDFPSYTAVEGATSVTTTKNPYPYPSGLNQASQSPFRVGAANATLLNAFAGDIGGVMVFDRKLTAAELMAVHLDALPAGQPIFWHNVYEENGQVIVAPRRLGFNAWNTATGADITDGTTTVNTNNPAGGDTPYIAWANSQGSPTLTVYHFIKGTGIPLSRCKRGSVRLHHTAGVVNATYLVIRHSNGSYYANANTMAAGAGGANTDWTASVTRDVNLDRAAANWRALTLTPGTVLALGAALTQDLPEGDITGLGVFAPSRTQAMRFTDFKLWKE